MMTTQEVIEAYDITRQTLNNWVRKKEIPAPSKKRGRQNVWTNEQVKYIDQRVKQDSSEQLKLFELDSEPLYINNRRYLGSKQKMLEFINDIVNKNTTKIRTVADIFGGTGVVADMFNKQGKKVIVNDILTSNYISYQTWFGTTTVNEKKIRDKIKELNNLQGISGYVTENFGNKYFSFDNAKKIDAIREKSQVHNPV